MSSQPIAAPATAPLCSYGTAETPADSAKELKRKSVRGGVATAGGQLVTFFLRLASTAILARLLSPKDYGLVAMTAVVTGFVGMFKDAGLTSVTVQRKDITHVQLSMLFWINLFLGCAIALILVIIAPLVGTFYSDARLPAITAGLALSFVFGGLTLQHQALLRRQMRFDLLAGIDVASCFVGAAVAISMALLGFSYWSLVGSTLATSAANALSVWLMNSWRPSMPSRNSGVLPLLKFGRNLLAYDIIYFFARQTDMLLIGRFCGPTPLAFYDRSMSLLMQPIAQINNPLTAVAVPALSRLQNEADQYRRFFVGALQIVTSTTIPIVVALALFADAVILLFFGPKWAESAHLFRLLAPAALAMALTLGWSWLLISLGNSGKVTKVGLVNGCLIITAFLLGVRKGAEGIAACYSFVTCLAAIPNWWYVTRGTPVALRDVLESWVPSLISCIPASLAALGISSFTHGLPLLASAAIGITVFGVLYAFVLLFCFRKWSFFNGILRQLRTASRDGAPAEGTINN